MATNNNAHTLDSAGNTQVDFVWGNMPLQPNDVRTENTLSNFGGSTGDTGWAQTTYATPTRLDFAGTTKALNNGISFTVASANHELDETGYAGYPAFTPATGKFNITQVDGDGTTVTYQCSNFLAAGNTVDITGCGSFNLTSATVASASRDNFTVTNSTTGSLININNGIVQRSDAATAADGAQIGSVAYIDVPSVLGFTTASAVDALKDAGYAAANITTAAGATNTSTQPTQVNVTSTTSATLNISGGTGTWPVGTSVTISAGTGIPAAVVGTWLVTGGSGTTLVIAGSGWTVANSGAITPGTVLKGTTGTIKTQSTAAGTASVALSGTITVTPWA